MRRRKKRSSATRARELREECVRGLAGLYNRAGGREGARQELTKAAR